jgi:hypothetical protein
MMSPVFLEDPPQREGIVAEAIRSMARELRAHEQARTAGIDAVLDRALTGLSGPSGRRPTAREVAAMAGVSVEDVLDAHLATPPRTR